MFLEQVGQKLMQSLQEMPALLVLYLASS